MNPTCNSSVHFFTVGDYVKSKVTSLHGDVGVGRVVRLHGESQVIVDWSEGPKNSQYHYMNLTLTSYRPTTAVDKVVEQLEREYEKVELERDVYVREANAKLANLRTAIDAVKAVKL